jgi:hypothetical protein
MRILVHGVKHSTPATSHNPSMKRRIHLEILPQPDDFTCGPTCLHAVYKYHNNSSSLSELISRVHRLDDGGTLGVMLGLDALSSGFDVTIYTYNLNVFDPTWFDLPEGLLAVKLQQQADSKSADTKLQVASNAYLDFLNKGGNVRFKDLNASLIRHYLKRGLPILTGLSSTYLYRSARERDGQDKMIYDDVGGYPAGHFVVLSGYDLKERVVQVADPYPGNPRSRHYYEVKVDRLINAILLGIVTYDANLVIIEPKPEQFI